MKISLYIHIPFCIRKCLYCDFLSGPYDDKVRFSYVNALINEIRNESIKYADCEVVSIFIGGGTPSLLSGDEMDRLLSTIYTCYLISPNAEISMEVNPGTVKSLKQMKVYLKAGINRLSIGLQSANNKELSMLGRIHTLEDFERTYALVIDAGFKNLNVDLISGLPGQKVGDFVKSLEYVTNLGDELKHISAYSLIIEEGTPFYDTYNNEDMIDDETDREIYKITNDILSGKGYNRYEISNYAKDGYECFHNMRYWTLGDYVGFGIGAASLYKNTRWKNIEDINAYIDKNGLTSKVEYNELSIKDQMEEFMFLGLRMIKGISMKDFNDRFNTPFLPEYLDIVNKYKNLGMMKVVDDRVMLTLEGLNVSNTIMSEFLF